MDGFAALDTALDRSIALGYGNVGYSLRRRSSSWPPDPPRLDGKIVLVTGAASGIGLASAIGFARLGARVLAVARNEQRAEAARTAILQAVPGADIAPVACDLASLAAIADLARRLPAQEPRLDVLVNNAGTMPSRREHSADGVELMFATHVLAPFALTALLSDRLAAAAPARVINVSSGGMYAERIPADDLESEQARYSPKRIYARTKREQVAITEMWAERLRDRGVFVHAMHPGWVDTAGVRQWMPAFRVLTRMIIRSEEQGADTIVWLGGAPEAIQVSGRFWQDRRERPTHYRLGAPEDAPAARAKLWEHCQALLDAAGVGAVTRS